MLNSLPLFVGLRYVRARSHKFFVSFITWVSLLCVCLGVTALIVILSVMNGLEGELRDRLLSLSAHARIFVPPAGERHSGLGCAGRAACARAPNVTGVAPYHRDRGAGGAQAGDAAGAAARHRSHARRRGGAHHQVHRRRQALRPDAGLRSRDRRARHCADAGLGRRRPDHRAGADHRRQRRAGTAPARVPAWPACSMRPCRTTTASC